MLILAKVNPDISESEQNQLVGGFTDKTEAYFGEAASGGVLVGGMVSLNRESSQRTINDTRVLFIIALIFILVILFLTFRKISDVLLTMMVIVVTIVWVMGLQGWLGYPSPIPERPSCPCCLALTSPTPFTSSPVITRSGARARIPMKPPLIRW